MLSGAMLIALGAAAAALLRAIKEKKEESN
jgi:hypothetical protein